PGRSGRAGRPQAGKGPRKRATRLGEGDSSLLLVRSDLWCVGYAHLEKEAARKSRGVSARVPCSAERTVRRPMGGRRAPLDLQFLDRSTIPRAEPREESRGTTSCFTLRYAARVRRGTWLVAQCRPP